MGKIICCNWVHPSGCDHIMRGETVAEVLEQAQVHAAAHGIETTPELLELVKGFIEDE